MATYLAHDALRLPAVSLLANSGLCVNIEIKIWLLLGVNVDDQLWLRLNPIPIPNCNHSANPSPSHNTNTNPNRPTTPLLT